MRRRQFITLLARLKSGWPQGVRVRHIDRVHLIVMLRAMAYLLSSPSYLTQELHSQGIEAGSEQQVFNNACRTCHTINEGDNRLGPNLHKIIGRKAGSLPDYNYSSAMKGAGFIWDEEKLDQSRSRKSGQDDKWNFCLTTAIIAVNRRDHEETTPPEPLSGLQGEGGAGRRQGRPNDSPAGRAFRRSS